MEIVLNHSKIRVNCQNIQKHIFCRIPIFFTCHHPVLPFYIFYSHRNKLQNLIIQSVSRVNKFLYQHEPFLNFYDKNTPLPSNNFNFLPQPFLFNLEKIDLTNSPWEMQESLFVVRFKGSHLHTFVPPRGGEQKFRFYDRPGKLSTANKFLQFSAVFRCPLATASLSFSLIDL